MKQIFKASNLLPDSLFPVSRKGVLHQFQRILTISPGKQLLILHVQEHNRAVIAGDRTVQKSLELVYIHLNHNNPAEKWHFLQNGQLLCFLLFVIIRRQNENIGVLFSHFPVIAKPFLRSGNRLNSSAGGIAVIIAVQIQTDVFYIGVGGNGAF